MEGSVCVLVGGGLGMFKLSNKLLMESDCGRGSMFGALKLRDDGIHIESPDEWLVVTDDSANMELAGHVIWLDPGVGESQPDADVGA